MAKIGQRPDGNKEERMGPLIMGLSPERDIGNGTRKEEGRERCFAWRGIAFSLFSPNLKIKRKRREAAALEIFFVVSVGA